MSKHENYTQRIIEEKSNRSPFSSNNLTARVPPATLNPKLIFDCQDIRRIKKATDSMFPSNSNSLSFRILYPPRSSQQQSRNPSPNVSRFSHNHPDRDSFDKIIGYEEDSAVDRELLDLQIDPLSGVDIKFEPLSSDRKTEKKRNRPSLGGASRLLFDSETWRDSSLNCYNEANKIINREGREKLLERVMLTKPDLKNNAPLIGLDLSSKKSITAARVRKANKDWDRIKQQVYEQERGKGVYKTHQTGIPGTLGSKRSMAVVSPVRKSSMSRLNKGGSSNEFSAVRHRISLNIDNDGCSIFWDEEGNINKLARSPRVRSSYNDAAEPLEMSVDVVKPFNILTDRSVEPERLNTIVEN